MDVEGFYLYFILFSECWLSQQFPTLTYAQSKPSPSTQIKQQPGCLFTDTFLRWNTNLALLEHSPTPGEMSRKGEVNSLKRLTCPLMLLLWANEISITYAHIIGLLTIFSLLSCGIWDTSENVMFDSNSQRNNLYNTLHFFHIPQSRFSDISK